MKNYKLNLHDSGHGVKYLLLTGGPSEKHTLLTIQKVVTKPEVLHMSFLEGKMVDIDRMIEDRWLSIADPKAGLMLSETMFEIDTLEEIEYGRYLDLAPVIDLYPQGYIIGISQACKVGENFEDADQLILGPLIEYNMIVSDHSENNYVAPAELNKKNVSDMILKLYDDGYEFVNFAIVIFSTRPVKELNIEYPDFKLSQIVKRLDDGV